MIVTYRIDQADFLTYHLYMASTSDLIKKRRRNNWITPPILYFLIGLHAIYNDTPFLGIIFFIFAILWLLFYPIWQRRRYANHYKSIIKESYNECHERSSTLEVDNEVIITKDEGSESKIFTTELENIVEIPSAIFVKLNTAQSFILPKDKIDDIVNLTVRLKELAKHLNIEYIIDDKWKWK